MASFLQLGGTNGVAPMQFNCSRHSTIYAPAREKEKERTFVLTSKEQESRSFRPVERRQRSIGPSVRYMALRHPHWPVRAPLPIPTFCRNKCCAARYAVAQNQAWRYGTLFINTTYNALFALCIHYVSRQATV